MGKLFDCALSCYSKADLDLQLKARFFFVVCLFSMVMIFIITLVTFYLHLKGFLNAKVLIPIVILGIVMMPCAFVLLVCGYFSISAHMIIIVNMINIWTVIIFDNSHPLSRLDTLTFVICILSLLPMAITHRKSSIFIYGSLNIGFMLVFLYYYRPQLMLPDFAVIDYISDNTMAILISCLSAYSVFAINKTALNRAKEEIEGQRQAEATVLAINRELIEKNRKLNDAQSEILSTNVLLRESEEKFSKAFHLSPLIISLISLPHGRFVDISNSFCSLLGYAPEDIIGKDSEDLNLWENDSDFQIIKDHISSEKKLLDIEVVLRSRNGELFTLLVSSGGVSIAQTNHIIMMGIDITKRKQTEAEKAHLEAQLRQAQKMEAIGHLTGGIAHDFNNMLSVVSGNTELVMMDKGLDAKILERQKSILDATHRSANLVRQLLAFSRKQTINPEVLDINKTIVGMLKMLQRLIGENTYLAWMPGQDMGKILIDPSQVDQILANLIVNARDAIQDVGKVTIETQCVVIDNAYCEGHVWFHPGAFVMLSVSDNGCGMDKKTLEKIFEPFFTTKAVGSGTGLGLSTVYGIVKQNDGFIHAYSEIGRGTTFKIYFPLIEAEADKLETIIPTKNLNKVSGTVLIVDDDMAVLDIGKSILEHIGFTVLTANVPENAIEMALSYNKKINLLLTDVVMPQMNGRELARRLGEIDPDIQCLYMSGYTENVIARHGVLEKGVNFLSKPFSVKDLADKIDQTLNPISSPLPMAQK